MFDPVLFESYLLLNYTTVEYINKEMRCIKYTFVEGTQIPFSFRFPQKLVVDLRAQLAESD
jgi:hypothetical protein